MFLCFRKKVQCFRKRFTCFRKKFKPIGNAISSSRRSILRRSINQKEFCTLIGLGYLDMMHTNSVITFQDATYHSTYNTRNVGNYVQQLTPYSPLRFMIVLNHRTSPSGHSQRSQNNESTCTVTASNPTPVGTTYLRKLRGHKTFFLIKPGDTIALLGRSKST